MSGEDFMAESESGWRVWCWRHNPGSDIGVGELVLIHPSGRTVYIGNPSVLLALDQAGLLPKGGEA